MADKRESEKDADPLDRYFAANMIRLREAAGLSQAEMVQQLRDAGWKNVHPTTISRIEKRERPVRLSEASRIATVLKQDLPIMVLPPEDAGAEEEVDRAVQYVADSYNKIGRAVYRLIWDRRILQSALSKFRVVVEREDDVRLREKLERADQFLGLHVDDAVATGRSASDDSRVSEVSDFMRLYGVTPFGKLPERAPGGGVDAEA